MFQVSEAHTTDVESLRRKSAAAESPTKSVRGTSTSDSGRGTATSSQSQLGGGSSSSHLDMVSLEEGQGMGSPARKQFQNGDVVVTLLPVNERFPWVTPARFRPELVPEELMAPALSVSSVGIYSLLAFDVGPLPFSCCH